MDVLGILIIFILLLARLSFLISHRKYSNKTNNEKYKKELLSVEDKDPEILNNLKLIRIPENEITFLYLIREYNIDNDLKKQIDSMIDISKSKLFDLGSDISNMELKKIYGLNNFNTLLEYDTNYKSFLSLIILIANNLIKYHKEEDSIKLLELGVKYGSDLNNNYILLATLYKQTNQLKKLKHLVDIIKDRKKLSQKKILQEINTNS